MRKATGLMAGPESPPKVVASFGRRVRTSMAIAVMVLITETASAPASADARAKATMSEVFGVSLTHKGLLMTLRQARTRSPTICGSRPDSIAPALMFGHETFI